MRFNTLGNRILLAFIFSVPSYTLLYLIRGYEFSEMEFYAHATYSSIVFLIILGLFEFHTVKSRFLDKRFPWRGNSSLRIFWESLCTITVTPAIVSLFMFILYVQIWKLSLWLPGLIEYNLFALVFSFLVAVFVNADVLIGEWKRSIVKNEVLEKENMKARLGALQAQVSPHFLFNNFNVLSALISVDPALARKYLEALSEIYRYILNNKNEELVDLSEEISFIRKYLFLLGIRFNDQINCTINVNGSGYTKVPPATLQILIENAVKHNEISGRRSLDISIEVTEEGFLEVRNKLQPKSTSVHSTGVGLNNIEERYHFLTDQPIEIIKGETEFTVKLPLLDHE